MLLAIRLVYESLAYHNARMVGCVLSMDCAMFLITIEYKMRFVLMKAKATSDQGLDGATHDSTTLGRPSPLSRRPGVPVLLESLP